MHCSFVDCVFRDCDLGVLRPTTASGATPPSSDAACRALTTAPKETGLGNQLRFDGCFLRYGADMAAHLPRVKFANSDLRETEFSDADLTGAGFAGCDVGNTFHNARLTEADFRGARGLRPRRHDQADQGRSVLDARRRFGCSTGSTSPSSSGQCWQT